MMMEGKLENWQGERFVYSYGFSIHKYIFLFLKSTTSHRLLVLTARFVSGKRGVVPRICISNSFLGNAAAAHLRTTY